MRSYLDLLRHVRENGTTGGDRTGTGTVSIFGAQLRFDLADGFPLVTTKRTHFHSIVHELLWMLAGETNIRRLTENGVRIWNEWADKDGELGPVYGAQWSSWFSPITGETIDQVAKVTEGIRNSPNSRRLIISAWNVADLPRMALEPCHVLYQFRVTNGRLHCLMWQRSADLMLGWPFNCGSASLLLMMFAHVTGYPPGEFIHSIGDAHIYLNHLKQVDEQLAREPYPLPQVKLRDRGQQAVTDFEYEDIELVGYRHHPAIQAKVAV